MQIFRKIYRRWNIPYIWECLVLVQLAILLILFLQWPVTLNFLVLESEYPYWWPLIQQFHAENPRIRIQLSPQKTTDDIQAIYKTDFKNFRSFYDLVYMDIIWLPKFAASDWLRDLSEQISPQELENFVKREVNLGRYQKQEQKLDQEPDQKLDQKRLYRIPFRSDVGVLLYRKDLIDIDQVPKTFADLRNFYNNSQDLNKQVPWVYFWQGKSYEGLVATFFEVLSAFNGDWINEENNEVKLDKEAAIEAIKFLRRMIDVGVSPPQVSTYTEENSLEDFQQGKAVFLRTWPNFWAKANADDSPIKGKVGMAQIVGNKDNSAGCLGGWGFGIAKNGQHPNEAWQAIKFFTSEEAQRRFVLDSSYLPTRIALFTDREITEKYPYFEEIGMLEQVEKAVLRPRLENYDEVSKILQEYLSRALFTDLSPEEAIEKAVTILPIIKDPVNKAK